MPATVPATAISRRTVTVLFADLVDSSGLVERLDPEAAHALLGRYFAAARAAIEAHGGTVEKFIGDAVMAVFGVPQAHEDDALRAIRAALDLHGSAPEADERLSIRIGISTGEVFAGGGGDALVTGAAVTLAKRLEQAARGGEVLVSAATQRLVRDAVRSRRAKRRDLTAFRVEELIEGAPGLARRFDTPLVGRDDELAALRAAFETACGESRCVLLTVAGEAGIGKTRLARELLHELRGEATVLVGRCVSYGEGATFLPLTEMIGREVLDAGSTGEIFLAARRRFEELAAERPLLLVFEDVHWAEPTLLDFVDYLAAQATGAPILALCLARPDGIAERAGWEASLTLEPLTDDQARELAGDEPQADRIAEIAEGNPLYVEQLLAYVGEEGAAVLDTVPGSIEALLASRLDRLGAAERATAQRAAVVGRRFSAAAVAALGPVDALPALEQAGFVRRARDLYRFHHVLVRDVVYAGTPKAERAELHREHADWLAAQPDGADELIGYHLEQAASYLDELGAPGQQVTRIATNAGRRLGAAGITAWKRGDAGATANLLGRATALLPEQDEERLWLMCELGEAMHTAGDLTRAERTLSDAAERTEAAGLRALHLRARLALLNLRAFGNRTVSADDLLGAALAAIPTLSSHDDDRALGRAWHYASQVHGYYHCRYAEAARAARQAVFHYQKGGWPTAACLHVLAASVYHGPTPVPEAISDCIALLSDADVNARANVLAYLAGLRAMKGDFDRARQELLEARSLFTEIGQGAQADIVGGQIEADIELLAGDEYRAQELLEANCSALERLGSVAQLATRKAVQADVLYRLGRVADADEFARHAQAQSSADDVPTYWIALTVQARVLARNGQFAEAEQLAEQAVALLDPTDIVNRKAACLLDFAEVLAMADRSAEGIALIERAVDLYRLKENDVGAARAQALLAAAI
jgi:class 3 adenylate cyclase